jgi:type IV pilus assembly protein PilN
MANINLLPWREERRQERQKEFLTLLGLVLVAGALLVFAADRAVNAAIEKQQGRNAYIQQHISELDKQVKEIRELENKKKALLSRMNVIQGLQGRRPVIVRVFDEMVRTVPDGVFYRSLSKSGDMVSVSGTAESNNRISSLMRNVDASEWFKGPNLKGVKANDSFGDQASDFELSFRESSPESDNKGAEK